MNQLGDILQLKIVMVASKPAIWRQILVPADYTFFDLHVAIQDAFGWQDYHLHQFFTGSPYKRNGSYEQISFPSPEMEDMIDERQEKLLSWFKEPKDKLWYEYDFGDSWMHEIKLEKIVPAESKLKYPILLDGVMSCPPEDCGGIGGYYDLIDILANPSHPEYTDMLNWLKLEKASEFDPDKFDKINVHFRNPKEVLEEFEKYAD